MAQRRKAAALASRVDAADQRVRLLEEEVSRGRNRVDDALDRLLHPCLLLSAVYDAAGRIVDFRHVYANQAACRYLGMSRDRFVGTTMLQIQPGHATSGLLDLCIKVLETGEPLVLDDWTYAQEFLDGQERRYDIRASAIGAEELVYTWRDVTARHQAQEALRESEARYRGMVATLGEALFVVDAAAHVQECNDSALELLGVTREEMIGSSILESRWDVLRDDGSPLPDAERPTIATLRTGEQQRGVVMGIRTQDGVRRWVIANTQPLWRPEDDGPHAVITTFTEFTALREAREELRGSEELLRTALAAMEDSFMVLCAVRDAAGRLVDLECTYANPTTARRLGRPSEDAAGVRLLALLPPDLRETVYDRCLKVIETGTRMVFEATVTVGPGAPRHMDVNVVKFGDGCIVVARDVTAQRQSARALADSEERFRLAFEEALTGMCLISVDPATFGRHLRVNRALCDFLGYSREELLGLTFADVMPAADAAAIREALQDLLVGARESHREERRYRRADGSAVWGLLSATLVRDSDATPLYLLAEVEDITARKEAEQELVRRALHDDLTGLPNRTLMLDHLRTALARAKRTGAMVGVLFVDLDDFKAVNDSLGHAAGDEFLVWVGERISGAVRGSDTVARLGGDEFVVVCEDLSDPDDAAVIAGHIQHALDATVVLDGQPVSAQASIGIAIGYDDSTAEELLRDADTAMYSAKHRGGRRWEPADVSLHAAALRLIALDGQLRTAVERNELRVYYQPTYDLASGALVAVEALLRWHHPERGLLLPGEFLDVAEQRGLITGIGRWVLDVACAQGARWFQEHGPGAPLVAVNVSTRQLGNHSLTDAVQRALGRSGLAADRLCLEITESRLLAVGSSAAAELTSLAASGVRLAVDDFGTGYSGITYLRRLPIGELKLDKSFVGGLGTDATDTALTTGVVALGLSLGLTVVAEGVETDGQLDALRDLGCSWGQGFLWEPAVPADRIDALLRARAKAAKVGGRSNPC